MHPVGAGPAQDTSGERPGILQFLSRISRISRFDRSFWDEFSDFLFVAGFVRIQPDDNRTIRKDMKMKHRLKTTAKAAVILVILGFVGLNWLAYNHARAMAVFTDTGQRTSKPEALAGFTKLKVLLTGVTIPRPQSDTPPAALDPACTVQTIQIDDITLNAWYCNRGNQTPLVVLFHGYSAEKTALLGEARAFLELGASVLLVDFRGSGGSSEAYTTAGIHEAEDVAAVVAHGRHALDHPSLFLFGQSMGAVAILRAIDQQGVQPDGVILEAVFDTMLKTVYNRFEAMGVPAFPCAHLLVFWGGRQLGFNGFTHKPVNYARSLSCPTLFMHGTDDPRAKLADGKRVFDAAAGKKSFVEFPNVGHEAYVRKYPAEWKAAVVRLLCPDDG